MDTTTDSLRVWRVRRGWTQSELAERAGVSLMTISNVETGKYRPKRLASRALAAALGVETNEVAELRG